MITTPQLEQNTKLSFAKAREDIYALYAHLNLLRNEMSVISQRNQEMVLQIKKLTLQLQIAQLKAPEVKEIVVQKVIKEEKKPELVGSMLADKVHDAKCVFARNIKRVNKIKFDSKQEALKNGYVACTCLHLF
jgi:hypothetical protein